VIREQSVIQGDGQGNGDEGVVKKGTAKGYGVVHTWGDADRQAGVASMECVPGSTPQVLVARKNGLVERVDVDEATGFSLAWQKDVGGEAVSAHAMRCSPDGERLVSVFREDGVGKVYDSRDENDKGDAVIDFTCPQKVTCTAHHSVSQHFAVGCQGAELKVYDGENISDTSRWMIFAAKGGKPNSVGLCDRPWNSAVAFNHGREDGSQIIVGTGYGKLRLYDTHVGRRPQLDVPFKNYRITCLAPEMCGNRWWVGDASGNLQVFDVRAGKYAGAIKGFGGSVRSLDIQHTESLIASAGLDRFVRVNALRSRSSLVKLYATSQLTAVRFLLKGDSTLDTIAGGSDDAKVGLLKEEKKTLKTADQQSYAAKSNRSKKRRKK
jgi:WD40 repeat protein